MISQNKSKKKIQCFVLLSILAFCVLQCGTPKELTVDDVIQKNIDQIVCHKDASPL